MQKEIRYFVHSTQLGTERHARETWICHEYDDHGNHRLTVLVLQNGEPVGRVMRDNWTGYQGIAEVPYDTKFYLGFTDYFGERVVEARQLTRETLPATTSTDWS